MSSLRKPDLGPIVGHTTDRSCRLWIAASNADNCEEKESEARRTLGVIGVVDEARGEVDPDSIAYFRLKRGHNRTGTFNLGDEIGLTKKENGDVEAAKPYPIKASTVYRVRLSTLSVDDAYPNDQEVSDEKLMTSLTPPKNWADILSRVSDAYVEAKFKTFATPPSDGKPATGMSFLLGSCRYPGFLWKRKASDRIFGPMLNQYGTDVSFSLMIGDQIYADLLSRFIPIGLADTYKEFQDRYRTAFGSKNMRELLRHIPTYMILDDHEIEDNWTQDRIKKQTKRMVFNLAIDAYMSYQWSHGPRRWNNCCPPSEGQQLTAVETCLHHPQTPLLYYDFLCSGYPFFVLDTRTQRFQDDDEGLDDNHLLGRPAQHPSEPGQLERLLYWLLQQQKIRGNAPKFIVSSTIFVPNTVKSTRNCYKNKEASDSWPAFPNTRKKLLDYIVEEKIDNVVFLCGDVHCSNVAKMTFRDGPGDDLTAYSITSSAFYWPFPFADGNPSDFVHDSTNPENKDTFELSSGNGVMDYTAWGFTQADNFCRIDIDPTTPQLLVQYVDRKGNQIQTRKKTGEESSAVQRLKLASW